MNKDKIDCFHLGVKALILNNEGKILLLSRNHPLKGFYWDIPGGRLHKGESQTDTLFREIREETGLDNYSNVHPFMIAVTDIRISSHEEDVGLIFSIFVINISEYFHPTLSDEHVDFEWNTPVQAGEKLKKQYPDKVIEKILQLNRNKIIT